MIYQEQANQIDILLIWDSRKDPEKLGEILKNESR
jgi:hypothetical protein